MDSVIDFDAASVAWRKNKKHIGGGYFVYTCKYVHTNGKLCNKPAFKQNISCKKHLRHGSLTHYAASD